MKNYSQHDLDAKISRFMKRKMHQFPELNRLEPASSIKPIEKHQSHHRRSSIFQSIRMSHAA